jgi:hypothetical protein|tara:strand:+ start:51 stop:656 length:606 start_codon:yes stop_codon:yes gene_type:complete
MKIDHIRKHLNSWGKEFVKEARKNLVKGKKGGGDLEKSIDFKVKGNQYGFEVELMMADYGAFQDKGVRGAGNKKLGPNSKNPGVWGGKRFYMDWEGKRKISPFQFGSGKSSGSIYKGIGSFIRKKGLQPRKGGKFQTTAGLKIAIVKTLWAKGIHGISFFQKALKKQLAPLIDGIAINLGQDVVDYILAKYPNSYQVKENQ